MRERTRLCFPKHRQFLFFVLLQFFVFAVSAQVRISGRITDASNKGVPAISVQVHNTTFGSVTDADGNYSFQANIQPGSYQLDISGVGYKAITRQLQGGSQNSYTADASLSEDALKMDEVVVTGVSLGTTRRQMGSYISTVKADELTKGATGNVLAALQ